MTRPSRYGVPLLVLVSAAAFGAAEAHAQVVVDWRGRTLVSYPDVVNTRTSTTVVVNNVNDLLYEYGVAVVPTPRPMDDAALLFIKEAIARSGPPAKDACGDSVAALDAIVNTVVTNIGTIFDCSSKRNAAGALESVPLSATINQWNLSVKAVVARLDEPANVLGSMRNVPATCTGLELSSMGEPALERARQLQRQVALKQAQVDGPHQVQQPITLVPENDYTVTVTEYCRGVQTATFTQKFSPSSTQLTLSLGVALSRIEQRSYSAVKDPENTQQNRLSVNGTGRLTPLGVALLNYEIPGIPLPDWLGLTVSSGLVLRLGSDAVEASSLGWFGGLGVHLYHRLFVAAGVHVGQFADYPHRLVPDSVIPSNYGDLNPVKRSTGRFAVTVTYQTKKFQGPTKPVAVPSPAPAAPVAAGATPGATPTPTPTSSPGTAPTPKPTATPTPSPVP